MRLNQLADKLSRQNKEFIQQLWPQSDIYATFFPQTVRDTIGKVGPNTEPVKKMLQRIGFRYSERIDPFDGGPHFEAKVAEITLVQKYRRAKVLETPLDRVTDEHLVAVERESGKCRFKAVKCHAVITDDTVQLPEAAIAALGLETGEKVHAIPFDG